MKKLLLVSFLTITLTGCATIIDGRKQDILVETSPVDGATCQLMNEHGQWTIPSTPGTVRVERASGDMAILCKAQEAKGMVTLQSRLKGLFFGNFLLGGVFGMIADVITGGAYDYAPAVLVEMNNQEY